MSLEDAKPRIVHFRPFMLDLESGEFFRDGRSVKLHPQPARLLILLVSRAGEILTRDEIQKALWEGDTHVDFDLGINSCIRQIRTALGDDAEEPRYLETIPRKGYRFIAPTEAQALESQEKPLHGGRKGSWRLVAIGMMAAALVVAIWIALRPETPRYETASTQKKHSIAVLYFENVSGDPDLEWLRLGITDMLITDLSQSPSLEILSADRLYQILSDMNKLEERTTSLDVVQAVAERADAETVVLGSFMKAGENIRINIRVQNARRSEILTTESIEGVGHSSIFSMVDELTRRIKTNFEIPAAVEAGFDRYLQDVTTPSLEAYRYFVAGLRLAHRGQIKESIPLFEKALEVDPHFARARTSLSASYGSLGHYKERDEHRRQAFKDSARLPVRERYFVEGSYHALKEETYERAFQTLEKLLELYPDDGSARNNLALRYRHFERFDEAIAHYEEAIRRKYDFFGAYDNLAFSYSCRGQMEKGYQVLQDYLAKHPDSSPGHRFLGQHFIRWGKLDKALETFQTSESIFPEPQIKLGRWHVFVLREEWGPAEAAAKQVVNSNDPSLEWLGSRCLARLHLYHGRSQEALKHIDQAVHAFEEPQLTTTEARIMAAEVLLERGNLPRALEQAKEAQSEGKGNFPEWEGLFLASLAYAKLDQWEEAESTAEELRRRTASLPSEKEKRRHHHLLGALALARGDTTKAINELEIAQSMLPARGFLRVVLDLRVPQHVPIWFSLASAYFAAGDEEKAAQWFERIIESGSERIGWPIPYVRSFYFLGKIHETRGEMDKAREYYRRFYEYWKDGDMDRERVEEAKSKLGMM